MTSRLEFMRYKRTLYLLVGNDGVELDEAIDALTVDDCLNIKRLRLRKWLGWTMLERNFPNKKDIYEYIHEVSLVAPFERVTLTVNFTDRSGEPDSKNEDYAELRRE